MQSVGLCPPAGVQMLIYNHSKGNTKKNKTKNKTKKKHRNKEEKITTEKDFKKEGRIINYGSNIKSINSIAHSAGTGTADTQREIQG